MGKRHQYVTLFYGLKEASVIHIETGKKETVFKGFKEIIDKDGTIIAWIKFNLTRPPT